MSDEQKVYVVSTGDSIQEAPLDVLKQILPNASRVSDTLAHLIKQEIRLRTLADNSDFFKIIDPV